MKRFIITGIFIFCMVCAEHALSDISTSTYSVGSSTTSYDILSSSVLSVSSSTRKVSVNTQIKEVKIYADNMIYDRLTDQVYASGNVRAFFEDMDLAADNIIYDRNARVIDAKGNIKFKREEYIINADKFLYNMKLSSGVILNTSIKAPPTYIYADKVFMRSRDEFFIPKGDITTCDHEPPHYKFKGKNITLKMKEQFNSYNTTMYIRSIPTIFYPYYSKKLGPRKLETDIAIGENTRNGFFLKTKVSYPFTERSRSYIGVDYLKKRGMGLKGGHNYRTNKGYSKVDLYYIKEKGTGVNRGRLYANGWHEVKEHINIRYRTEYTSNYQFNYDFEQREDEYIKQDLYYQVGLEYSRRKYLISTFIDKRELWDKDGYKITEFILPGIKFNLYPVYGPAKIRFLGNTLFTNEYSPNDDAWKRNIIWDTKVDKTYRYRIGSYYRLAIVPGFGFDGSYRTVFRRFWSFYLSSQHSIYKSIAIDTDYTYRRTVEFPYAVIKKLFEFEVTFRPLPRFFLKTESVYDFREDVDEPLGNFLSRTGYRYGRSEFYVKNRYDPYENIITEWLYEINLIDFSDTRIKYNHREPQRLDITQSFTLGRGYRRLSLGTRFYLDKYGLNYKIPEFVEHKISFFWNLHCWDSEFRLLKRGDETQFWVLFNITAFKEPRAGIYSNLKYKEIHYYRE